MSKSRQSSRKPTNQRNVRSKPRGNSSQDKDVKVYEVSGKSKHNDAQWYVGNGQIAKDVASFSFNTALGTKQTLSGNGFAYEIPLPGIMAIYSAPTVGMANSEVAPINVAARNIYSYVRHANSGHANYDAPDLMCYLLAMDSIYSMIAFMQRVYGVAQTFSQRNRYIGDALLQAMRMNPADVRSNIAQLRGSINMYITKASALATPTTMSLYKRHMWMYDGIYQDEDVIKSQLYMYVPAYLYKYKTVSTKSTLEPEFICASYTNDTIVGSISPMSVSTLLSKANTLLNAILASEDCGIMSGDIMKAYKDQGLWQMTLLDENKVTLPSYVPEVLDQIHNTTFFGAKPAIYNDTTQKYEYSVNGLVISQDTNIGGGTLTYYPIFVDCWQPSTWPILDMSENDPDPERVLVATRNMGYASIQNGYVGTTLVSVEKVESLGSDICFYAIVYYYAGGSLVSTNMYNTSNSLSDPYITLLTKFHKAPLYYVAGLSSGAPVMSGLYGEIGNFLLMSPYDLEKVHQSSMLNMMGVPNK